MPARVGLRLFFNHKEIEMSETNATIAAFAEKFELFKTENIGLIDDLETTIEEHLDDFEDVLDDYADELKSLLGSSAANEAGEEDAAQESAISEAEEWVADNVSNSNLEDRIAAVLWVAGCDEGQALLRNLLQTPETVTVRLTLDVTYELNGEDVSVMLGRLRRMAERAIGEGMLTGETETEVHSYSIATVIQPEPLSEDELADFMLQRIEDGRLDLEDIPVRLARYGLMEPTAFVAEMRERMELAED